MGRRSLTCMCQKWENVRKNTALNAAPRPKYCSASGFVGKRRRIYSDLFLLVASRNARGHFWSSAVSGPVQQTGKLSDAQTNGYFCFNLFHSYVFVPSNFHFYKLLKTLRWCNKSTAAFRRFGIFFWWLQGLTVFSHSLQRPPVPVVWWWGGQLGSLALVDPVEEEKRAPQAGGGGG